MDSVDSSYMKRQVEVLQVPRDDVHVRHDRAVSSGWPQDRMYGLQAPNGNGTDESPLRHRRAVTSYARASSSMTTADDATFFGVGASQRQWSRSSPSSPSGRRDHYTGGMVPYMGADERQVALSDGSRDPSVRTLATAMAQQVYQQDQINRANRSMHAINFLLNYCGTIRSNRIEGECRALQRDISRGERAVTAIQNMVAAHSQALEQLETEVESVQDELKHQNGQIQQINTNMADQEEYFNAALSQYDSRLQKQQSALQEQNEALQRLLAVRFKSDFGVDVGIVLLSAWLSDNFLVRVFSNILASALVSLTFTSPQVRKRRIVLLMKFARLAAFLSLHRYFKELARLAGVHSSVGSAQGYIDTLAKVANAKNIQDTVQDVVLPSAMSLLSSSWTFVSSQLSSVVDNAPAMVSQLQAAVMPSKDEPGVPTATDSTAPAGNTKRQ